MNTKIIIVLVSSLLIIQETFMMFDQKYARFAGVGTIFIQNEKVLCVFRTKTGRNDNKYGLIGGLVEPNETPVQAAIREIYEEVGVTVKPEDLELVHIMASYENNTEAIGCYFLVKKWEGEPYNKASHRHAFIEWVALNNLPENIIPRNRQALENMQKAVCYSEYGYQEENKKN